MEDQYAVEIMDILRLYGIEPQKIEGTIISSIVPPSGPGHFRRCQKVTGVEPMMVGPGTKPASISASTIPPSWERTCW